MYSDEGYVMYIYACVYVVQMKRTYVLVLEEVEAVKYIGKCTLKYFSYCTMLQNVFLKISK